MNQDFQNQLVERIINSKTFGTSHLYANLLKYLVECTQKDAIPKESEVSLQLFGGKDGYKDTGKVRVHIYNLRKRLKEYFEKEGKEETHLLTIPKGSYKVEFVVREEEAKPQPQKEEVSTETISKPESSSKPFSPKLILFSAILFLSILIHVILWVNGGKADGYSETPTVFWKEFLDEDKPTLVVLGDLYIFSLRDSISRHWQNIRIPNINSESQFKAYKEKYFGNISYETDDVSYTYLIKSSVTWIEQLTKVFYPNQKTFSTRVMSRLEAKDLQDHNIIFVGMQKTAGIFNNYFLNSDFNYSDSLTAYSTHLEGNLKLYSPTGSPDEQHKDYGFIAKFPGPNNNTVFMIGGIWDTATSESLKNFTDPVYAQKLENLMKEEFGKVPEYFEMLVEISGMDRVGLDTKIIKMQEVKADGMVWTSN